MYVYSISLVEFPWETGGPIDYSETERRIRSFLQADPEGVFLLRIGVWPGPGWRPDSPPTSDDMITLYDGTILKNQPSLASDTYFKGFLSSAQKLVQHLEASALAGRILGYTIGAQNTGEWFPYEYVTNGPDYSIANKRAFRLWLRNRYGSDAALSQAWGKTVRIDTAEIPLIERSRLPLGNLPPGTPIVAFYDTPSEQDWIDCSRVQWRVRLRRHFFTATIGAPGERAFSLIPGQRALIERGRGAVRQFFKAP